MSNSAVPVSTLQPAEMLLCSVSADVSVFMVKGYENKDLSIDYAMTHAGF